jgi:fumarylacetoacetase
MRPIDETHDPGLRSWVESANDARSEFPIQNLPFGVFRSRGASEPFRIGVAIGDAVLDLRRCHELGMLEELPADVRRAVDAPALNRLMGLGAPAARALRHHLVQLLRADSPRAEPRAITSMNDVELGLPASIGDYTDFYASVFHATRVGRLFRPDSPLLPNYKFVPIGYHGRASSIVASGTPIRRPWGQVRGSDQSGPEFRPTRALDYELEVGLLIGAGNVLGEPVSLDEADDHLFGLCLLNDWSARDIQAWEYQPLGPFLAKNFATTLSPWVVTLEALAPFRCAAFARAAGDPRPLPYLSSAANAAIGAIDVQLEVTIQSSRMRQHGVEPMRVSRSSLRTLYWTPAQLVAHHTSNGCNLQPGDVLGTGTVSGDDDHARGCLLELTANGREPLKLSEEETRSYLEDGDEVTLRACCERERFVRIGFGRCSGSVLPAIGNDSGG